MKKGVAIFLFCLFISLLGCIKNKKPKPKVEEKPRKEKKLYPISNQKAEKINRFFSQKAKRRIFSGNVWIQEKDSFYTGSFGFANIPKRDSLTLLDRFQLASVSKPLTAYAILKLAQQQKLSLEDSVQVFFPDFPYSGITVRMLLAHRSGLGNYMYITDSIWSETDLPMCNENALDSFISLKPAIYYPVNKRFDYCNTNYFLLASIIEEVSNMSFESFMQKEVFVPLGMTNSLVYSNMDYASLPNIALGHDNRGRVMTDFYLNGVTGDKGVFSTVADLAKFHEAIEDSSVLAPTYYREMHKPHSPFDRNDKTYALGWRLKIHEGDTLCYHNGWWRGYRTYFVRYPKKQQVFIVLSNTVRGRFLKLEELLALLE